jgi:hypothetical protein
MDQRGDAPPRRKAHDQSMTTTRQTIRRAAVSPRLSTYYPAPRTPDGPPAAGVSR